MAAHFLGVAFMIDREEKLYRVAFSSIDKKGFLKLVSLARRKADIRILNENLAPGDRPGMFDSNSVLP